MCRMSPFAGADLRTHGTLADEQFVVTDRRGDIGGLWDDRGNTVDSSLRPDNTAIYRNNAAIYSNTPRAAPVFELQAWPRNKDLV